MPPSSLILAIVALSLPCHHLSALGSIGSAPGRLGLINKKKVVPRKMSKAHL